MTEKQLDSGILADNIRGLFQRYLVSANTFTEQCIIQTIWNDVLKEIKDSYR